MYVNIVDFILDLTVTPNKPAKKHQRRDSSADTCDPPSSPEKKMHKSAQRHAPATAPDKKLRKDQIVMQVLQHVSASY